MWTFIFALIKLIIQLIIITNYNYSIKIIHSIFN